jgi:Meiotically up-regulated gene 113
MNFAPHTPESLLPRSDSKNPATTCKGINLNGRPCRRSLAVSPRSSPSPSPLKDQGVLAVLRDGQDVGNAAAAFYCWQHKDQAERVAETEQNHTDLFPLQERTSIDTIVDRVGVMNLEDVGREERRHERRKKRESSSRTKHNLPTDWQRMQGPLMSVPSDMIIPIEAPKPQTKTSMPRSNVKASLFCCVRDAGEDENPPPRLRLRRVAHLAPGRAVDFEQKDSSIVQLATLPPPSSPISRKPVPSSPNQKAALSPCLQTPSTPTRPSLAATPKSTGSQTRGLLSLIPSCLSPQTTSVLLTELSKPISSADAVGYIYMFWLTPESQVSKPDDDAASDLLEPPRSRSAHDRRPSDVLQRYASQRRGPTQNKTMLLKIGRAENVHRRLSQWAKQCSYNITLVRYYPYTSSRTLPSNSQTLPTKVPHVHRVERLIHVELAEKRVTEQGPCETCGREHREWFEVEASRDGLRAVDEVIRRWVAWAERQM